MMLVREPNQRATLKDIVNHPWVISGDEPASIPLVPLVSREHISEDDHSYIIQKMAEYRIGTKEEIVLYVEVQI